jgi:hypothetical protein
VLSERFGLRIENVGEAEVAQAASVKVVYERLSAPPSN